MIQTKKLSYYGKTLMVAHMGAKGLEPENTIAAYIASANRSYYGIETDVHITKDGYVIATHDDNAKRVSGVDINVEEANFEDLRKLRLYDNDGVTVRQDLYMPSLEEYISICKKYGKIAVLELKNKMKENDVYKIYDIVDSLGYNDNTVYISFAIDNLHAIREKNSNQKVQFLIGREVPENLFEMLKEYRFDLDVYSKAVTKDLVDKCHAIGATVNVWTVDNTSEADELIALGVDFITTNIIE